MSITIKQIVQATLEVAREYPDFVYSDDGSGCWYTHGPDGREDSSQGCLIGQGMMRAGVPRETLEGCGSPASDLVADLVVEGYVEDEDEDPGRWDQARFDLDSAQQKQDIGFAWGECIPVLEQALARYPS